MDPGGQELEAGNSSDRGVLIAAWPAKPRLDLIDPSQLHLHHKIRSNFMDEVPVQFRRIQPVDEF
jgi:hypothetical protein